MAKNLLEIKHDSGEKSPEKIIESLEQNLKVKPITVNNHSVRDAQLIA